MLRRSPLDAVHRAAEARMVAFGGWEMPLQFRGTIQEHRACRESVAVFDVSHLGTVVVRGGGAFGALQRAFTNDLGRIAPGRAQYTHLLDPADASVVDDLIVWWLEDRFEVLPNASNTAQVRDALAIGAGGVEVRDATADRALIAIQGPAARDLLRRVMPRAAEVGRFRVETVPWGDEAVVVAGTGYTGEDGVECAISAPGAGALWSALVEAGAEPAGLGARDTLRLEAGLPLHGHELGPGITPLEAGLGWVVAWDKGDFRGRAALEPVLERGPDRMLRGVVGEGRRPLRDGSPVPAATGRVGVLTSGNFSPMLGRGIGLGFVAPEVEVGAQVEVQLRGSSVKGEIVEPPFYRRP